MSSKIGGKFYRRTDFKMTLWYVFTFLVSGLIICGFLYLRLEHQLIKEVDRLLIDETKELGEILTLNPNGKDVLKNFESHVEARTLYPVYFQILTESGDILYISKRFEGMGYKLNERIWVETKSGKESRENIHSVERKRPFRVISTPITIQGDLRYIIQMGTHLKYVRKSLSNFKSNILAVLPILLILGTLGGWFLARKSLSPIGYIASKAQSITSQNLSERLTPRGTDDEMDDLIRTINGMIARLETSFQRMAEFTADASHELKTPICAMRGEAEILLSKGREAEEYQEGLAHFIEQFDHLNQMINDLILLSKSDSSQGELKMVPLRLDLLIKNIGGLFQGLAEQKNISFIIGPFQDVMVMGNKMRLQQLFTNLIDNAIKFTPEGTVRITMEKNEEVVLIKIKDTGIGIPKGEQERIFKRFYRVDKSRSRETGGVGLGLSIAEWIAYAHHGKIEVKSEVNQGSTFTIYLPIQNAKPLPR
jgi:heavy metal sensor kinase